MDSGPDGPDQAMWAGRTDVRTGWHGVDIRMDRTDHGRTSDGGHIAWTSEGNGVAWTGHESEQGDGEEGTKCISTWGRVPLQLPA